MKTLSIPKLEIAGSLSGIYVEGRFTRATFNRFNPRTFLWTDSTTVLQWLRSINKLPSFVASRYCETKELTTVDKWFHVNSGISKMRTLYAESYGAKL